MSARSVVVLFGVAFIGALATLALPIEATPENARAAHFGYPIFFVTADTGLTPPAGWHGNVQYDPNEYPTDFHWDRFAIDWALVAGLLAGLVILVGGVRKYARARPLRPSARRS
jgi:hypothetical protein